MSFRVYLVIGVFIGGMLLLLGILFGEDIAQWGRQQQTEALIRQQDVLAQLVFDPFIWMFESRPIGPIVAVFAWPFVFAWILMVFIGLLIIAGVDVAVDVESVTRLLIL